MARLGIAEGTAGASAMDQPQNIVEELKHWPDDRLDQALETAIYSENSPMPTEGPLAPGYLVLAEKSRRNDIRARGPGGAEAPPQGTVAEEMLASSQGMGPGMGGPQMDPNMMPPGMPPQGMPPQGMPQEDPMQFLASLQGGPQGMPPGMPQGMPPQGMPPQGMPMGPMMANTGGLIRRYANGGAVAPRGMSLPYSSSNPFNLKEERDQLLLARENLMQTNAPTTDIAQEIEMKISEIDNQLAGYNQMVAGEELEAKALADRYDAPRPLPSYMQESHAWNRLGLSEGEQAELDAYQASPLDSFTSEEVEQLATYGPQTSYNPFSDNFLAGDAQRAASGRLGQVQEYRRQNPIDQDTPPGASGLGVLRDVPSQDWVNQQRPGTLYPDMAGGLGQIDPASEEFQRMFVEPPMRSGQRPEAQAFEQPVAEPGGIAAAMPPPESFADMVSRYQSSQGESPYAAEVNQLREQLAAQNQGQSGRYKDAARLAFAAGLMEPGAGGINFGAALRGSAPFLERAEQLSSENNRRAMLDQLAALESNVRQDQFNRQSAIEMASGEMRSKEFDRQQTERERARVESQKLEKEKFKQGKEEFSKLMSFRERQAEFDTLLEARGLDQEVALQLKKDRSDLTDQAIKLLNVDDPSYIGEAGKAKMMEDYRRALNMVINTRASGIQTAARTAR
jgi:hypothetical protein